MDTCPNCKKEITQVSDRRKREFCSVTCRSAFWYKKNKDKKKRVVVKDLTKPTNQVKPKGQSASNYSVDTIKNKIQEKEEELSRVPDVGIGKQLRRKLSSDIFDLKVELLHAEKKQPK